MHFVPRSALLTFFLKLLAIFMMIGGAWAFLQSPSGTQFPIPIAVGGFVLFLVLTQ